MATNTYVELDRAVLVSNTGPIIFSNIPQTYTDLRIVFKGGFVDSGFMIGARVGNNTIDTGANYSYQLFRGSSSGVASSYRKSGMVFGAFCQQGGNNLDNVMTVDFFNYSNTTTFKTWSSRYSNPIEGIDAAVSLWRSTAAINTISIAECGDGGSGSFNYGNMLSGTTISLYGIRAEGISPAPKATGGVISSDSTYYYHTFPATGVFRPSQSLTCDYFVVAGGGAAGAVVGGGWAGGGGGGGGYRTFSSVSFASNTNYTATVGAGGAGRSGSGAFGLSGVNTSLIGGSISTTTSGGGGGGTSEQNGNTLTTGQAGGSGGGGPQTQQSSVAGGAGNAGSYTPVEGYSGFTTNSSSGAGWGGGAGGPGTQGGSTTPTNGVTAFDGVYYARGGNVFYSAPYLTNGVSNTGNGGGSRNDGTGTNYAGGNGGSGIVVIRYAKA